MFFKRTILRKHGVAVETKWYRVPWRSAPEWIVCRQYMLDELDYDPLDIKSTILYSLKGNNLSKDSYGNPRSIAAVNYLDDIDKDGLKLAHNIIVGAIEIGLLPKEGNITKWLYQQHPELLQRRLISSQANTK